MFRISFGEARLACTRSPAQPSASLPDEGQQEGAGPVCENNAGGALYIKDGVQALGAAPRSDLSCSAHLLVTIVTVKQPLTRG